MKRKVLACFLLAAMLCTAVACGGKEPAVESESTQSAETVVPSQSEEVPKIDYSPKYEAFLDGSGEVNAGAFPFMNPNVYDREELFFDGDGIFTLEEFILKAYEKEGDGYDDASIENVSYAYIDCGADGEPELALKADFLFDNIELSEQYVIKGIGDEIQLTYMDRSYYRDVISIVNRYGKVVESGSIGYVMDLSRVGYLNADGQYDFCYDDYVSYAALYALDERFDSAVAESRENLDDLFLHIYSFETMGESTDYEAYLKTRWYSAEKADDDFSNGVNFKENERVSRSLFDAAGVRLYTMAEVQDKMAARKQELGVSSMADRDDAPVEWKEISLKDSWIAAARKPEYKMSPSPEADFELPYADELSFDAAQLPELADTGDADSDKIDSVVRLAETLSEYDFYENGPMPDYFYGEGTVQTVYRENGGLAKIVTADVYNGDTLMDDLMKSVGYGEYYVSYFYNFGDGNQNFNGVNEPVLVKLNIDSNLFTYFFADGQLVRRIDNNGTVKDNLKTNDFIKTVYKIGCYYGNVLNAERGRYMLMMTGNAKVTETSEGYVLRTGVQGLSSEYDFLIDERTDFFDRSECVAFDGYEPGDTPRRWLMRVSENPDDYPMALMGLFDIKASGNHIDYFYGCYWWD